jgi:hypothetical protein
MAAPNVNFTVLSNGLGNTPPSPSNVALILGCSSTGDETTVTDPFRVTQDLIDAYGYGPGIEPAANLVESGVPTMFMRVPTDVEGESGAVTHTGTGVSVMTVTDGADGVLNAYDVIVTVVRDGTAGSDPEPGFTISLDGGKTTSREIRMPSNHIYTGIAATTGMTLNFTAATMVTGDTYTLTTTGPTWAAADVADCITAFKDAVQQASMIYVVGACSKAQADTIATAVGTLIGRKKFDRCFVETRDIDLAEDETLAEWKASISADFVTFNNDRFCVCAGAALIASTISKVLFRSNVGQLAIVRATLVSTGRSLGAVEDGALAPKKDAAPVDTVFYDEGTSPGLDANRFLTLTSYPGLPGQYFVTRPLVMSSPTSDFTELQYGRVMDEGCRVTNIFFTQKLNTDVRLNRKTGKILEVDARALQSGNDQKLAEALVNTGQVSDAFTTVSREDNISTSKTLTVTVSILPLGYLEYINVTLTFINPVFSLAA